VTKTRLRVDTVAIVFFIGEVFPHTDTA
jgi:hypothetical protein